MRKRLNTECGRVSNGASMKPIARIISLFSVSMLCVASTALADHHGKIKHSFLTMGGKTAIISENDEVVWSYRGGSRDGFVLPNGNVLIAFAKSVEEVGFVPEPQKLELLGICPNCSQKTHPNPTEEY